MKSNANATPKVERREERHTGQRKVSRPRVRVPINRHALGRRNETVAAVRDYSLSMQRGKQPGRRYGPPPKRAPKAHASAPVPLNNNVRKLIYVDERGVRPLTARQMRQVRRMETRAIYGRKAENRARRGSVTA